MTPATDATREAIARAISKHLFAFEGAINPDSDQYDCGDWEEMGRAAKAIYLEAADDAMLAFADTEAASQPREGAVARLMHVIDRDRYAAAACVNAIDFVLHARRWLREAGRGSYAYDDDRYQEEFGLAFDEIVEAMRPMRALSKDKSDCTTDPEKVQAARAAGREKFAVLTQRPPEQAGAVPAAIVWQQRAINMLQAQKRAWLCGGSDCTDYDHGRDEGFDLAVAVLRGLNPSAPEVRAMLSAAPTPPDAGIGSDGAGGITPEWCLNMARLEAGHEIGAGGLDHPLRLKCELPPPGWICTREPGHDGPCAALATQPGDGGRS